MMLRVKDIAKKDDKTFTIALKEPYGLVVDLMAKTDDAASSSSCARRRPRPTRCSR